MKGLGWHAIAFVLMLAAGATIWWCATHIGSLSPAATVVLIVFAVGGTTLFLENSDYMQPEFFKIWKPTNRKLPHQQYEEDLRKAEKQETFGAYVDVWDDESSDFFDDPENQRVLVPDDQYDDPFADLSANHDDEYLKG